MQPSSGHRRFDPAASAAAIAFFLVVLSFAVHPWTPASSWIDAVTNQWLVLFTGFFWVLHGAAAVLDRVPAWRNKRPA